MRFMKLLLYIAGNYVFHVSLIGEIQTGFKKINYLGYKYKMKKLPEGLQT